MENAIWKNENLIAQDVADEFELEREVRKASGRKELRCPDGGCKCPIVRYCHGEVKGAYFAHLTNDNATMRILTKAIRLFFAGCD